MNIHPGVTCASWCTDVCFSLHTYQAEAHISALGECCQVIYQITNLFLSFITV